MFSITLLAAMTLPVQVSEPSPLHEIKSELRTVLRDEATHRQVRQALQGLRAAGGP